MGEKEGRRGEEGRKKGMRKGGRRSKKVGRRKKRGGSEAGQGWKWGGWGEYGGEGGRGWGKTGEDCGRMRQGKLRGVNQGSCAFPLLPCLSLQQIIPCAQSLLCPVWAVTRQGGMVRKAFLPFIAKGSGIRL